MSGVALVLCAVLVGTIVAVGLCALVGCIETAWLILVEWVDGNRPMH